MAPRRANKGFAPRAFAFPEYIENTVFSLLPEPPTFQASNLPTLKIRGKVSDGKAGTIVNLHYSIVIDEVPTEFIETTSTNGVGDYSFNDLGPGEYYVKAIREGTVYVDPPLTILDTADREVNISGVPCIYTPGTVATIPAGGGTALDLSVNTDPQVCEWIATTNVDWIIRRSGAMVGNQSVHFDVLPNPGATRTGQIIISGRDTPVSVPITQAGGGTGLVEVSGRVFTTTGLGLRNAVVSITDSVGTRRTATTSSFGVYTFPNVAAGQTYTLTVSSKRYRFAPLILQVNGAMTNLNFNGLE